ncbi:MAG: hypothetical protein JSV26_04200 [bacterium]|nr:MAG: hypothetical protein JSV26_04200 [bacterium]
MRKPGRISALRSISTLAVLTVLVAGLLFLSSGPEAPSIPSDPPHLGAGFDIQCVKCHSPGAVSPLKKGHTPEEQCLQCHGSTVL